MNSLNFFKKIIFSFKKPKVIIITGQDKSGLKEAISQVLNQYFRIGNEVLIFESNATELEKLRFFIKKSPLSILVSKQGIIEIQDKKTGFKKLTIGFQDGADFQASDVKLNGNTNFKINYKGNIVPVWLEGIVDENQICLALTAAAVGTVLGLNLVEISQALKNLRTSDIMPKV